MRFSIVFNSTSTERLVAELRIGISPEKSCFEIFSWRSSLLLERRHATTQGQHLSEALTDGGQQTHVALRKGTVNDKHLWTWNLLSKVSVRSLSVIVNGRYEELPQSQYVAGVEHARELLEKRTQWWLNTLAELR